MIIIVKCTLYVKKNHFCVQDQVLPHSKNLNCRAGMRYGSHRLQKAMLLAMNDLLIALYRFRSARTTFSATFRKHLVIVIGLQIKTSSECLSDFLRLIYLPVLGEIKQHVGVQHISPLVKYPSLSHQNLLKRLLIHRDSFVDNCNCAEKHLENYWIYCIDPNSFIGVNFHDTLKYPRT